MRIGEAARELVRAAFEERCRDFEPRLKEALDQRLTDVARQIDELCLLQQQLGELRGHLTGDCACDHPAGECCGCSPFGEPEDGCCTCCTGVTISRSHTMSNASVG